MLKVLEEWVVEETLWLNRINYHNQKSNLMIEK